VLSLGRREVKVALFGGGQIVQRPGTLGGPEPAHGRLTLSQARPHAVQIPARARLAGPAQPGQGKLGGGLAEQFLGQAARGVIAQLGALLRQQIQADSAVQTLA